MNSINEQQDNTSADRMSISSSQSFIAQNAHDAAVAIEVSGLHVYNSYGPTTSATSAAVKGCLHVNTIIVCLLVHWQTLGGGGQWDG